MRLAAERVSAPLRAVPTPPASHEMTLDEVAERLHTSRYRAAKQIREGVIPGRKIGARYVIVRRDFEAWAQGMASDRQVVDLEALVGASLGIEVEEMIGGTRVSRPLVIRITHVGIQVQKEKRGT